MLTKEQKDKLAELKSTITETKRALSDKHKLHKEMHRFSPESIPRLLAVIRHLIDNPTLPFYELSTKNKSYTVRCQRSYDNKITVFYDGWKIHEASERYMNNYATKLKLIDDCYNDINEIYRPSKAA